ncbi:conserved exported protein of unknown function [Candidatus Nitrosocosmicus franklandus]|uniref:Uncharacterized protein n=2 Tax=Candidatus Nitrosocosmicus franklandianus TaxID=1798806 RepID=A0A484ICX9_9ARCH|nr:conserved exported protein of unknown function [Candidatus Nitrosocosmicus franklandus]
MNRGLKYYGIMLTMIATLVFTLNDFAVVNATTGINQNNSTQINPLNELLPDSSGVSTCDECAGNNGDDNGNNRNDDKSDVSNRNDNTDDNDGRSSSSSNSDDDDDDDNKDNDGRSSSSNGDDSNNNNNNNDDDVPMSLPFNSNVADESDDEEKDYSSAIPFP